MARHAPSLDSAQDDGIESYQRNRKDAGMKPRLKKVGGLWVCRCPRTRSGLGYTAMQAYDDWLILALIAAQQDDWK